MRTKIDKRESGRVEVPRLYWRLSLCCNAMRRCTVRYPIELIESLLKDIMKHAVTCTVGNARGVYDVSDIALPFFDLILRHRTRHFLKEKKKEKAISLPAR